MAHIQMTDRNPSDLGLMEELTDEELLAINGGGIGALGGAAAGAGNSILTDYFMDRPIDWRSAGAQGAAGAITVGIIGGIGGAGISGGWGGLAGASLAG